MHFYGQNICCYKKKDCIENDCFASVWRWTLMELSKTQSIYYHDEWLSGESFPCPPSWSIGLQWQRWGRKGRNNRFCDFEKLRLPSLSGWYEHRSWAAHNSEGWEILMECGNNKGSKMRGNYERAFESPSVLRIFCVNRFHFWKATLLVNFRSNPGPHQVTRRHCPNRATGRLQQLEHK